MEEVPYPFLRKIFGDYRFYLVLLLAAQIPLAFFYVTPNFIISGDATGYNETIRFLGGEEVESSSVNIRLLTVPLLLYLSHLLNTALGDPYLSIMLVNLVFYFLIVPVFFRLVFEIYRDKLIAFFASILFFSNYYFFNADNFFIGDLAGRFFFLLTNLLALLYFLRQEKKYFYLAILSSVVGVFFKEFGALGMLTLGCFILLSETGWREKIKQIFKAGLLFLTPLVVFYALFYLKFHYSYLNWYDYNVNLYPEDENQYGFGIFLKVMGWVFLAGWPLFLYGLWQEKKNFVKERAKVLLALLPSSLMFFAWPMFMQRTAFILVPWLSMIAAYGLSRIGRKYVVALIVSVYIALNYNLERLLLLINLPF
ncbi:MAG: glycosyltransferase family 39 protein [Minisyncoccia bacterium]